MLVLSKVNSVITCINPYAELSILQQGLHTVTADLDVAILVTGWSVVVLYYV